MMMGDVRLDCVSRREAVEQGLRTLLRLKQQTGLRKLRGNSEWVGDLDAMRRDK